MDIGQGLAQAGQTIGGAIEDEHKNREQIRQMQGIVGLLNQVGVKGGNIVQIDPNVKDQNVIPIISKKASDAYLSGLDQYSAESKGRLQVLTKYGSDIAMRQIADQLNHAGDIPVTLSMPGGGQVATTLPPEQAARFSYEAPAAQALTAQRRVATAAALTPKQGRITTIDGQAYREDDKGNMIPIKGAGPTAAASELDKLSKIFGEVPQLGGGVKRNVPTNVFGVDPSLWGTDPNQPNQKLLGIDAAGKPIPPAKWGATDPKNYQKPANWYTLPSDALDKGQSLFKKAITKTPSGVSSTTTVTTPSAAAAGIQDQVHYLDPNNPDADWAHLDSGTPFIGPDGKLRTKP